MDKLFYSILFSSVWETLRTFGYTHYGVETGDVDESYLERLESMRSDEAQGERRTAQSEEDGMGLHNDI